MAVFVRRLFGIGKLPDDLHAQVESEGLPTETFGLRYSAVQWTYTQQTMDGKSKPGQVASWRLATNQAAFDAPNMT